jgi:hypothetical protein
MDESGADRAINQPSESTERPEKRSTNREKRNKNYGVRILLITKVTNLITKKNFSSPSRHKHLEVVHIHHLI